MTGVGEIDGSSRIALDHLQEYEFTPEIVGDARVVMAYFQRIRTPDSLLAFQERIQVTNYLHVFFMMHQVPLPRYHNYLNNNMSDENAREDLEQKAKDAVANGKEGVKDAWAETKAAAEKTKNAVEAEADKM